MILHNVSSLHFQEYIFEKRFYKKLSENFTNISIINFFRAHRLVLFTNKKVILLKFNLLSINLHIFTLISCRISENIYALKKS